MKHIAVSAAVALVLGAAIVPAQAANDGTIEFTGTITATTCLIEGEGPGGDLVNKEVALNGINVGSLAADGDVAGHKGFTITVGGAGDANCTNGKTAYVRFDPSSPAMDHTTGRLNIDTGTGAASNVQVEVTNVDGTPINMFSEDSQGIVIADNTAVIPMIARYRASGQATEGVANSRVGFQVVYD